MGKGKHLNEDNDSVHETIALIHKEQEGETIVFYLSKNCNML